MSNGQILVVGGDGQIGVGLTEALQRKGVNPLTTTRVQDRVAGRRKFLDLDLSIDDWPLPHDINVAFLTSATTSLQACEEDPDQSWKINVTSVVRLAERLINTGARVVFLSTNQVFDGTLPHQEATATVTPFSAYGRQKAAAEEAILKLGPATTVVRLTKVFGAMPTLFVNWLEALKQGEEIKPFSDMVMAPIMLTDVCDLLCKIGNAHTGGIYQLSAIEDISYADAACHLANLINADPMLVNPVNSVIAGIPVAVRPSHTSLEVSRVQTELGWMAPSPFDVIDALMADRGV